MHHVLQIPEVLMNIFCHCNSSGFNEKERQRVDRDLAALARTCRAFKEPALDILWSELQDPSPLSRCLPEISVQTVKNNGWSPKDLFYSFTRPLERAEWDILRSYARRVWSIRDQYPGLDWESVKASMDFTPAEPLFPSLRALYCDLTNETIPLLQLALPSLIRLQIQLLSEVDLRMLRDPLMSLTKTSPNIKRLVIRGSQLKLTRTKIVSDSICLWSNLQRVYCPYIPLDADALVHLSCMPALVELKFTLNGTFLAQTIPSDSPSFTTLKYLKLCATSLVPISKFLSWARLPSVIDFTATIDSWCPSKQDLVSFMSSIQTAGMDYTVQKFNLEQVHDAPDTIPPREPDAPLLDMDDLRPCMIFHNIRHMNLDLQWDVNLSDNDLLTLASAWPEVEELLINAKWGWNRPGGITPNGLASFLQKCPFLTSVALAIDTRGYTEPPAGQFDTRRFRGAPSVQRNVRWFRINVLDSLIEEESLDAMAVLFSKIVSDFKLTAWETWSVLEHPDADLYCERWEEMHRRAHKAIDIRKLTMLWEQFLRDQT